jgi:hypothetical protein
VRVYAWQSMVRKPKRRHTAKIYLRCEATNVLKSAMAPWSATRRYPRTSSRNAVSPKGLVHYATKPRGSFSLIFFLQCLYALGYKDVKYKRGQNG